MDLRTTYTNIVLVSLVIFALMSFTIILQNGNDAPEKLMENQLINDTYSDLYGNLSNQQLDAQTKTNVFDNFTPNENLGVWEVTPIVSPTRGFKALTTGLYNILIRLPMQVLGVSPIVAAVMSGIFLFLLILGAWGIWKGVFKI